MGVLHKICRWIAEVMGDGAYARYCAHMRLRHPEDPLPTPREFYLARLNERYTRPSRCC